MRGDWDDVPAHSLSRGPNAGMYFWEVYADTAYDRPMKRPEPRFPKLATAFCSLFALAAFIAVLINRRSVLPFYFGFGFLAVVLIVWFWNWRSGNT
jgi:hypothetical protein